MTAADDVVHGRTNTRRRTRTRLDDRLATAVVVFFPHPLETNKSGDGGRRKEGRNRKKNQKEREKDHKDMKVNPVKDHKDM